MEGLHTEVKRLRVLLSAEASLCSRDWTRVLVAAEVAFASDLFGSGVDWGTTTGLRDAESIVLLRRLQRKLAPHVLHPPPAHGRVEGDDQAAV